MAAATLRHQLREFPSVRLCAPSNIRDADFAAISQQDLIAPDDATVVEGESFEVMDVPDAGRSGFTHFLDGAQKAWSAGYIGFFPFRIAHTSAALLERRDRAVSSPTDHTWSGALEFFAPEGEVALEVLSQTLKVHTVSFAQEESALAVQLEITKQIENRRKEHELLLAASFTDGCLLIDGGIGEAVRKLPPSAFVVGLVKSHQRQYFRSLERREKMLNMKAGQRSSVFLRPSSAKQGNDAYSFYLKMRDGQHQPPMFGLARIETPAEEVYLRQADDIAGWLLHERCPLSLPDPRFHVLPYPIHLVERHLKARQPSDAAIRGLIGL